MKSTLFSLNWRDAGKAVIIAFLTALVTAAAQALGVDGGNIHWPTGAEWFNCVKVALGASVAYLIKNFLTDDVSQAKKTIADARA